MITSKGVITFPALFEPKPNPSGMLKFSCSFLIDKTDKDCIAKLQAEIAKAITKGKEKLWSGKLPKFNYQPLRDGDAELKSGDKEGKEYEGRMFLNCAANVDSPPGVVDNRAQPLLDKSAIYSGCIVRIDIKAFPYKNSGNCGVGWWLNNVMLVSDGPRLDGKMHAMDAFAQYAETETDTDLPEDELA